MELVRQANEQAIADAAVISDLISKDMLSNFKKEMNAGARYYNCDHDILYYDPKVYIVDGAKIIDPNKADNKLINPFHRLMVQQKSSYIAGESVVLSADDNDFSEKVNSVLGEKFNDILPDWIEGASNKAVEWLHPYINSEGEFDYVIIPAEQIIPVFDTSFEKKLEKIVRYYPMKIVKHGYEKQRNRVELWDDEKVTYYMEDDEKDGEYYLDPSVEVNPQFHYYTYNTLDPKKVAGHSWNRVPFVPLWNNSQKITDLKPIKLYIDAYDKVSSGFINDLEDIQLAFWILKGYDGTDLSEFMQNLIKYKAMKVSGDGGVESKSMDIPSNARQIMLQQLENKIYEIGQGVNMSAEKIGGAQSGVALKFLYSGLDLKTNTMIRKLKKALQEFMWFATEYINRTEGGNYNYKDIRFTFNKSKIINEAEMVDSASKSLGMISDKTVIANHPWVDNAEEEIEQKRLEQEERNRDRIDLSEIGDDDPEDEENVNTG